MFTIKDQLDRAIDFKEVPNRIVSLVPSQTELLVDLGLKEQLIGITKFCVHPKNLRQEKQVIGGTKNIDLAKIAELKPDIIICNKEENTSAIVKSCNKIAPVYVSNINGIEDNYNFIHAMGQLFDQENKADVLMADIRQKAHEFLEFIEEKPSKKVVYFIWRDPWMVAARSTFINELLILNKFQNVYRNEERYPEIDMNTLSEERIDYVLLSSEPYPFKQKHLHEIQQFTNAKILLVNGEYFSWYGSRLLSAFEYFKTLH